MKIKSNAKFFTILLTAMAIIGSQFLSSSHKALATENLEEAKINSVKVNMHTFQTMLETHAVDWEGFYPDKIADLKKEAESTPNIKYRYWKVLKNPFVAEKESINLISYSTYMDLENKKELLKGSIVYMPIECQDNKLKSRTLCKNYKVYGLDENGNLIKSKGSVFFLSSF